MLLKKIKSLLDRPGGRTLLGPALTVRANLRGNRVRIFCDDGYWVHQFKEGTFVERRPRTARNLAWWLEQKRRYWASFYRPRPGDTVIEVGAGVGIETLLYSRALGQSGRVIAIEAHPGTFDCLVRTCERNGLTNVTPLNIAVVDRAQTVHIEDAAQHIGNAITAPGEETIPVAGKSIDQVCDEEGIAEIACIRMNIEGAEQVAIKGMVEAIRRTKFALIACHDFKADRTGNDFFRTRKVVTDFLLEHGFRIVDLHFDEPWAKDHVYSYNPLLVQHPLENETAADSAAALRAGPGLPTHRAPEARQ